MRYKVIATLTSGERLEVETPKREWAEGWFDSLAGLALAGPKAISLTQENDDSKDVVLAIGANT